MPAEIDVTFDFRSDTPPGKDPDTFSSTLSSYHQLLVEQAVAEWCAVHA